MIIFSRVSAGNSFLGVFFARKRERKKKSGVFLVFLCFLGGVFVLLGCFSLFFSRVSANKNLGFFFAMSQANLGISPLDSP